MGTNDGNPLCRPHRDAEGESVETDSSPLDMHIGTDLNQDNSMLVLSTSLTETETSPFSFSAASGFLQIDDADFMPSFFDQPWLVSNLFGIHAQETSESMPLLCVASMVCNTVKVGATPDTRARMLLDARVMLEQATNQLEPNSYDVLASMVALSEVWDLEELCHGALVVDVRSLEAMTKMMERCLASPAPAVEVNSHMYWCVYVYDAFEAVDLGRLPFVQDTVVQTLASRFPLRRQTPLAQWFVHLERLASIARDIAKVSWSTKASSQPVPLDVQQHLLTLLREWKPSQPHLKVRDDFLSLLHNACFVYLYDLITNSSLPNTLDSALVYRQIEADALAAIVAVSKILSDAIKLPRPSFLDMSRTAVHLALTFAMWALEYLESHVASSQKVEQDGMMEAANTILEGVAALFDLQTDPGLAARYDGARTLQSQVHSLRLFLGTFTRSLPACADT